MTATVQPETKSSSRRALLAGALGGLGAWVAGAIGRPAPLRATNGDIVTVGGAFSGISSTWLTNTAGGGDAFHAYGTTTGLGVYGESGSGSGVRGYSASGDGVSGLTSASSASAGVYGDSSSVYGVHGHSASGYGVFGDSATGTGMVGSSTSSVGVYGITASSSAAAAVGRCDGNSTGVLGSSGVGYPGVAAKARTGVYGYANQTTGAVGVWGESPIGLGVYGKTTTGYAGYFNGKVFSNAFYELGEIATPAAPVANRARLFVRDNGLGKTQLCVRFHTGVVKVLVTEP